MYSLDSIQAFLQPKEMAISGVSRNPKKFGRVVYDHLVERGFKIYPVNPNIDKINGDTCYKDVASLPDNVDRLYIVTPKDQTAKVVEEAASRGIKYIWIQQRAEDEESVRLAEQHNINLIYKECIFKFAEPVTGPHAFHRFFSKLFGSYPK
jgi:predicted CoA-binding protein